MRTLKIFLIVTALASVPSATSWAAVSRHDRVAAQKLINKGLRSEKQEQWKDALDSFQQANDLRSTPTSLYHMARSLQHLGRLIEAREYLQSVIDNKMGTFHQRKKVKAFLSELEGQIPHLTIQVPDGFDGVVKVDGTIAEMSSLGQRSEVDPGTREIHAEADGYEPFDKTVVLSEGDDQTLTIELVKAKAVATEEEDKNKVSSESGSGRKTIGYVSLAVGGAGLIAGTAFGFAAKGTRNDLRDACDGDVCSENQRDLYDKGKSQATYSTIGFIVGGVGLGAGAYFLLTAPSSDKKSGKGREVGGVHVQPVLGFGSVGVQGSF